MTCVKTAVGKGVLLGLIFGLIAYGSGFACHVAPTKVNQNTKCLAPPQEYATGYLQQTLRHDDHYCAAYGFINTSDDLCYFVLCQPSNDCTADWLYDSTQCPQPEVIHGSYRQPRTELKG